MIEDLLNEIPLTIIKHIEDTCYSCGWPEKETENTIEIIGNIHENPELLEKE